MSEQRWRIVDATGAVREVSVEPCHARGMLAPVEGFRGWRAARVGDGPVHAAAEAMGDGAHEAVARLAAGNGWPVAEILAPGEPTRAEAVAAALREGAEAMREAAAHAVEPAGWGSEEDNPFDGYDQWDTADALAARVRALPLPGDATPADEATRLRARAAEARAIAAQNIARGLPLSAQSDRRHADELDAEADRLNATGGER